jgi:hypothetical protein
MYQLFIIRSVIPLIIFMGLEYLLSFEIRKDNKLGFRSITSGIQIALISFLWFREITLGAQDLFFRNMIAIVVFVMIGVLLFLEIGVSFLEKRTLIELSTQLFLSSIKLIFILSGKELPLSLMVFIRCLLSLRDIFEVYQVRPFMKALLLYLAMSLFYFRTGHRDSFYKVNLMDPSVGQEQPNILIYSLFVTIN